MSVKINDILSYLKTQAAAMPGMNAERVSIGPIEPTRVGMGTHIVITEVSEPGDRTDGATIDRMLKLEIGVLMKIDPLGTDDPDIQINAIYQPLHALFESYRDGVTDQFLTMVEDSEGPSSGTVEGEALNKSLVVRFKSCGWTVTFERTLGQTN